jgi:hypothetical protein
MILGDWTPGLGMLDSNSEMSSQNIPLKGRTDFRDAAEFRPQRLFAFELRGWEMRSPADSIRADRERHAGQRVGLSNSDNALFALKIHRKVNGVAQLAQLGGKVIVLI